MTKKKSRGIIINHKAVAYAQRIAEYNNSSASKEKKNNDVHGIPGLRLRRNNNSPKSSKTLAYQKRINEYNKSHI